MNFHSETGSQTKLRFGVMCSGDELPAGFAKSVELLLSDPRIELALVIVDTNPPLRSTAVQKAKAVFSLRRALWALHARLFPAQRLPCYKPVGMSQTFTAVPKIRCSTNRKGKFSEYFRLEDIEAIRGYRLDFILRFAFGIIRGDILKAAKYGIWSFHHGDETKFRGGPPGFWEIYHDEPVTAAVLQRLTDRLDGGVILQKCIIKTRQCSHGDNLNAIMWATTYMPLRVCRDILNDCAEYLEATPSPSNAPVFHAPNDFQMVRFLYKTASTWLKQQFMSVLFAQDWNIGIVQGSIDNFLTPGFQPRVAWLSYKKPDCYIADPFLLRIGSKLKLLAEEFDLRTNRGSIVETDLSEGRQAVPLFRKAIDEGVHMSYPYLFEHEGRYYCTPEAWQKQHVSLYAYDIEREVWSPMAVLIPNLAAVDSTILEFQGRWWLFCTNHDDEVESKLFLWHSPKLLGPWEPHPGNPVKMDVRSSRPAGRPFVSEGQLYRPAQDSSLGYGGAITINRVTCLTVQRFSEEPVAHVTPIKESPYRRGIHTAVSSDSVTVIDGNRLVFAPRFA